MGFTDAADATKNPKTDKSLCREQSIISEKIIMLKNNYSTKYFGSKATRIEQVKAVVKQYKYYLNVQ